MRQAATPGTTRPKQDYVPPEIFRPSEQAIALPGISPIVEKPGVAMRTKRLPFNKL
jgi:hypothetical protein